MAKSSTFKEKNFETYKILSSNLINILKVYEGNPPIVKIEPLLKTGSNGVAVYENIYNFLLVLTHDSIDKDNLLLDHQQISGYAKAICATFSSDPPNQDDIFAKEIFINIINHFKKTVASLKQDAPPNIDRFKQEYRTTYQAIESFCIRDHAEQYLHWDCQIPKELTKIIAGYIGNNEDDSNKGFAQKVLASQKQLAVGK